MSVVADTVLHCISIIVYSILRCIFIAHFNVFENRMYVIIGGMTV